MFTTSIGRINDIYIERERERECVCVCVCVERVYLCFYVIMTSLVNRSMMTTTTLHGRFLSHALRIGKRNWSRSRGKRIRFQLLADDSEESNRTWTHTTTLCI